MAPTGSPPVIDVQIALQGGGAKLFSLLVAMREVERLEMWSASGNIPRGSNSPRIKVTHIVGTSAGAIVAALYAARVPMQDVLDRLGTLKFKELIPRYKSTSKLCNFILTIMDPLIRLCLPKILAEHHGNFANVLFGDPIYDLDGLKSELIDLFNTKSQIRGHHGFPLWGDFRNVKFEKFGKNGSVPLSVVRTELRARKPRTSQPDDCLIDFLADSAAIPFVFRNINQPDWDLLDGGICANLPSDFLYKERRIAIGFESWCRKNQRSKLRLAYALLDVAIDYSVERSVQLIGKENCCRLNSELNTFDFNAIIGSGTSIKSKEEETIRCQTKRFLESFLERAMTELCLGGDRWKYASQTQSVAQHSALASKALRDALFTIGRLTPSTFCQYEITLTSIAHLDKIDNDGTFASDYTDERVINVDHQRDKTTNKSLLTILNGPLFKAVLAYPPDALLAQHSIVGELVSDCGTVLNKVNLVPIPCLDEKSERNTVNGYINRVALLDLSALLNITCSLEELYCRALKSAGRADRQQESEGPP